MITILETNISIISGVLGERFGGKRVFFYFMLFSAVATLLCPLAASIHVSLFIAMRVLVGIGQVSGFPEILSSNVLANLHKS